MVRSIIGTLIEVGLSRWPAERVGEVLAGRNRAAAGTRRRHPASFSPGPLLDDLLYNTKQRARPPWTAVLRACIIEVSLPPDVMSLQDILSVVQPGSIEESLAHQVNFDRLPAHVAVIMDGNGRWAAQRHLPRVEGHRAGIESVREVVEGSARLGIQVLTLYAFSVENWKRPASEVSTSDGVAQALPPPRAENAPAQ